MWGGTIRKWCQKIEGNFGTENFINKRGRLAFQSVKHLPIWPNLSYICLHDSEPCQQSSSKNTTSTLELQYHYNHKLNHKADEMRTWRKDLWEKKEEKKNFSRTTSNLSRKKCGAFITAVHCWHRTLMCIWCASRKWRKECHWNGNYFDNRAEILRREPSVLLHSNYMNLHGHHESWNRSWSFNGYTAFLKSWA